MESAALDKTASAESGAPADLNSKGRSLVRNVLSNWAWYLVVIASGFVLPRLIDQQLGTRMLGLWDLGWSLVFFVSMLSLNVASAITRHVARFRALQDWDSFNGVVNSCLAFLGGGALVGMGVAVTLALMVHRFLPRDTGPETIAAARHIVLVLAAASTVQLPMNVFNAVITGHERYDLQNLVRGAVDILTLAVQITLLFSGFTVLAMAVVILAAEVVRGTSNYLVVRRLCPRLRLSFACCRFAVLKEMVGFSGKTIVQSLSQAVLYEVNKLFISATLGPAGLAVYARPRALIMHTMRFLKQYAHVFVPTSSALEARGQTDALRRLLVRCSQFGMYITLPIMLLFCIMGGPLLRLWMGEGFERPGVVAILAAGHVLSVSQLAVYMVLLGLGRHGRPALFDLAAALVSIALGWLLVVQARLGMIGAALAVSVPVTLSGGVATPLYACRLLHLNPARYLLQITRGPVAACLPFALSLLAARVWFAGHPYRSLGYGLLIGCLLTVPIYWRWVLPESLKAGLLRRASALRGRFAAQTCAVR